MSQEDYEVFIQKCKQTSARSKKIRCVETGEVFRSLTEAALWTGCSASLRGRIKNSANDKSKSAGKHPVTKERLHWEYVD